MRILMRVLALLLVAGAFTVISTHPQAQRGADAEEGDWAAGWNTWLTSEEGDWVRYNMGNAGVRYEVLERLEENRVRYQNTTWSGEDQTSDREFTRPFARLPGPRMPFGDVAVEWRKDTFKLGELEIQCDVAQWAIEGSVSELWVSLDVPCGGVVKQMAGGVVSVELIAMQVGDRKAVEAPPKDEEPSADTAPEGMPKFLQNIGNIKTLRVTSGDREPTFQRREVRRFTETSVVVIATIVDSEGKPQPGARINEMVQKLEDWKNDYGTPDERGVKVEVPAGTFECDYYKRGNGEEWIMDGVLIKRTIKTAVGETVVELMSLQMGQ